MPRPQTLMEVIELDDLGVRETESDSVAFAWLLEIINRLKGEQRAYICEPFGTISSPQDNEWWEDGRNIKVALLAQKGLDIIDPASLRVILECQPKLAGRATTRNPFLLPLILQGSLQHIYLADEESTPSNIEQIYRAAALHDVEVHTWSPLANPSDADLL